MAWHRPWASEAEILLTFPPLWAALLVLPRGHLPARLLGRCARLVIRVSGCRLRVRGLDRLRHVTPAVLVANHASYVDSVILMAALPVDYRFVVNHHLASYPFFGLVVIHEAIEPAGKGRREIVRLRDQARLEIACSLR